MYYLCFVMLSLSPNRQTLDSMTYRNLGNSPHIVQIIISYSSWYWKQHSISYWKS